MEYKDTSIKELKLTLVNDNFNFDNLTTVKEKTLDCGFFTVKLAIVGASHVISLYDNLTKMVFFTEIIANYDIPKKYNSLKLDRIDRNNSFYFQNVYVQYQIDFKVLNPDKKKNRTEIAEFYDYFQKNKDNKIYFDFGSLIKEKKEFSFPPETLVVVSYNEDTSMITVNTLHCYPEENRIFKTTSTIEVKVDKFINKTKKEYKKIEQELKTTFNNLIDNFKL